MRDRIDLADIAEKLVAEPLPLGGAAHETGNVDEGKTRRHDHGGFGKAGEGVEARIGHRDLPHIRLDRAERIVRRLRRRGRGQRVEERRLADIGQADNAAFEAHSDYQPGESACTEVARNGQRIVSVSIVMPCCLSSVRSK